MSHFAVIIIGENPEEQIAPYSERIEVEKYKTGDVTDEERKSFSDYYTKIDKDNTRQELTEEQAYLNGELSFEELYEKHGDDWNGNSWEKDENGLWCEYSTYNPKSKWDWYSLGGRWTGFFKAKEGVQYKTGKAGLMTPVAEVGYADQLLKRDIDFEFMRNEAGKKAAESYDYAMNIIGELPVNETWDSIRDRIDDRDESRKVYWDQPRCKAWQEAERKSGNSWRFGWSSSPDEFLISREEYIENARVDSCVPFAVVKDGQWYERGEMGWWACVSNEKDEREWSNEVYKLLDSVSDDTLISLYDCHI